MSNKYYEVLPSIWPFYMSLTFMPMGVGLLVWMQTCEFTLIKIGFFLFFLFMFHWSLELCIESSYYGYFIKSMLNNLFIGYLLFLFSEIITFLSLFYANFSSSISSSAELGFAYPPLGISCLDPLSLPLFNTLLLISGSITITAAHHLMINPLYKWTIFFLLLSTFFFNLLFSICQAFEYSLSNFSIADSIFSSNFYALTFLHGLHVLLGTLFVFMSTILLFSNHFTTSNHSFFIISSIYIHFVDVMWLFLFLFLYCFGF